VKSFGTSMNSFFMHIELCTENKSLLTFFAKMLKFSFMLPLNMNFEGIFSREFFITQFARKRILARNHRVKNNFGHIIIWV